MKRQKPVVLCILDGWGFRDQKENNAIEMGNTPVWHQLIKEYPTTMLKTSGLDVGLPNGQMGNSEVGHTNLGAGRIVMQDLPRIDQAIESHTLDTNPVLTDLISSLKETKGTCHLMGLLGTGGVHAQQSHIIALASILNQAQIPVAIHGFTDGRDTAPDSARGFISDLEKAIANMPYVKLATVSGRYYAMDRDNRWERIELAYEALVNAKGPHFNTANEAISSSYDNKVYDEFIIPSVIGDYQGMQDGDGIIMANYRSDRAREITRILLQPDFSLSTRSRIIHFASAVAMTEYSTEHNQWLKVLFPPEDLVNIFGEVVSNAGLKQLRIAETEKYAHVTFFFNGGKETLFPGEERILIASPKVATYDLKPEMSAYEVTDKLVEAIENDSFDVIIVNYANGDMVGHTGILSAAIKAVEAVDSCLGRVINAVKEKDGIVFVTADHGNAERMVDEATGAPYTAHTNTPVQAVLVNAPQTVVGLKEGRLCDVAPTLLDLLHLKQPSEMSGQSLLIQE
ncbi:MAG: 2,3-bisphosphoglycerate-independent phosphoglycerate mutase [Alphaproteobacteria bacterium]|nr:2,3-bisphosphoglycerate-independent phosphoglycerate mutase [Alphaproteobacteria bacterium]